MYQRTRIYDHRWDPESDETTPADALGSTMCRLGQTEAGASTGLDFDARGRANIRMAQGIFELALEGTTSSDFITHERQE